MDLYTINNDFSGVRTMEEDKELVEFQAKSLHRVWYNEQTDSFDAHWHTAMEIIEPIENYYDIIINEKIHHINPGDILFIPPGIVHEIVAPEYGRRYVYLIDISSLTKMNGFAAVSPVLSSPLILNTSTHPKSYDEIRQLLSGIRDWYFSNDDFSELKIHALITETLIKLAEYHLKESMSFQNTRLYKQKEYAQKFGAILDYIEKHYTESISLELVTEVSGFSKFHFSRLFKQYTDMTFCDYLNYRRLTAAEELLAKPDLSITEVALQTGFPSIATFNRIFKQKHGCTPTEYRLKNSHYKGISRNNSL